MKDNNYILQYYQAISDGSENVGKLVKLAYEYVLDGLQDHSFYYNHKKAIRPIRFIENFVHHSKGKTGLLKLELWQKAFLSCVFGLVNGEDLRQFKEIVLSTECVLSNDTQGAGAPEADNEAQKRRVPTEY